MVTTERLLLSRCCWATPRENPVSGMSKKSWENPWGDRHMATYKGLSALVFAD